MNLNGKVFNPGEMRTTISLQTRTATAGAGGFIVPSWSTLATVMCKWVNAHGSEVWTADAEGVRDVATVTIRYRSDIDPTCAVLKGSDRYEIVSMDDIQERNELIELKVKRLREG